ncbi:MAG: right-handed parallel beta-helix repeat-containing protein, partial [Candidatus Bathyarchaeia archaeon]
FVDINHPRASDSNLGTLDLPFKTITKAAQVAQAGDTIVVKAGTYRETVRLERGGKPNAPITFVAEPLGKVVIKGSDTVNGWELVNGRLWKKPNWTLAGKMGIETGDKFVFRYEQVFYKGKPLKHVEQFEEMKAGTFWVDLQNKILYVWLSDEGDPNKEKIEVSSRSMLWYGNESTPYIHLKGFRFEHCANRAQRGAIHIESSYGWIIEDCRVEWANGTGLRLNNSSHIAVRRCSFNNNGQLGVGVSDGYELTFEDSETSYNNWKGYNSAWESGGVKVASGARHVKFIRHRSAFNHGPGIWLDYAGYGNQIIGSSLHDNTANAGIQIEVTFGVLIANNLCYRNSASSKGGASFFGSGILLQNSGFCFVYHNTCVDNDNGLSLVAGGRPVLSMGNRIFNNVFAFNREYQIRVWDSVFQRATGLTFPIPNFVPNPKEWIEKQLNRFDYNLYFDDMGRELIDWGGPYNNGTSDKGKYKDLKEFSLKTSLNGGLAQETNGIVSNPGFINRKTQDFRLGSTSPAINKGMPLNDVKTDFRGEPRPKGNAPDLGAYEIQ